MPGNKQLWLVPRELSLCNSRIAAGITTNMHHQDLDSFYSKNRDLRYQLAQLWSVDITGYNEQIVPTPSFASDPAWSPLLS